MRITVGHHKACRVELNSYPMGMIAGGHGENGSSVFKATPSFGKYVATLYYKDIGCSHFGSSFLYFFWSKWPLLSASL